VQAVEVIPTGVGSLLDVAPRLRGLPRWFASSRFYGPGIVGQDQVCAARDRRGAGKGVCVCGLIDAEARVRPDDARPRLGVEIEDLISEPARVRRAGARDPPGTTLVAPADRF